MLDKHYKKTQEIIERRRFFLLLMATLLVLILPAFSGSGRFSDIIFMVTMIFLFIQSMVAAGMHKKGNRWIQYFVAGLTVVASFKPLGIESMTTDIIKVLAYETFFIFVMIFLIRFIRDKKKVDMRVLIASINIYLLGGIVGAFLAFMLYRLYPGAYHFPDYIPHPVMANFTYYSFITLSTVGYGDIVPRITETQTLAYILSVSGQLYIAIIIAFLVGKLLTSPGEE